MRLTCAATSSSSRCAVVSAASSSSCRSVTARRVFDSASCSAAAARRSASCRPAASASNCGRRQELNYPGDSIRETAVIAFVRLAMSCIAVFTRASRGILPTACSPGLLKQAHARGLLESTPGRAYRAEDAHESWTAVWPADRGSCAHRTEHGSDAALMMLLLSVTLGSHVAHPQTAADYRNICLGVPQA